MQKSDSIQALAAALAKAQAEFPPIPKDKTVEVATRSGGKYKFAYAPLDTIMEKIRPTLKANGLAFMQSLNGESLTTTLLHTSGEWLASDPMPVRVVDSGSQAFGSAITYARRYALTAMLGIVTEDDDDGNAADGNSAKATVEVPRPNHKPVTKDVWDSLSTDEQTWLNDIAEGVRTVLVNKGGAAAMATLEEQGLSSEHKIAIWSRFDSKERSAMKKKEAA